MEEKGANRYLDDWIRYVPCRVSQMFIGLIIEVVERQMCIISWILYQ